MARRTSRPVAFPDVTGRSETGPPERRRDLGGHPLCGASPSPPGDDRVNRPAASVRIEVRVELKPGVLDAEAESIEKTLVLLGIPSVRGVTTARVYDLEFSGVDETEARRLADQAVDRLLANPVIHRVTVTPRSD